MKIDWLHTTLAGLLIVLGSLWFANWKHWDGGFDTNKEIAIGVNAKNIQTIDSIRVLTYSLSGKVSEENLETWQRIFDLSKVRHLLTTKAVLDSIGRDTIYNNTIDSIPEVQNPYPNGIIDSVVITNISQTRMGVWVYASEPCQAVGAYGTESGEYLLSGIKENSYNYSSHRLNIGNKAGSPLVPGTTYYIRAVVTDSTGANHYSDEYVATTLQ